MCFPGILGSCRYTSEGYPHESSGEFCEEIRFECLTLVPNTHTYTGIDRGYDECDAPSMIAACDRREIHKEVFQHRSFSKLGSHFGTANSRKGPRI